MVSAVGRHAISPPNSNVSPLIRAILVRGDGGGVGRVGGRQSVRAERYNRAMSVEPLSVILSACRTPIGSFGGSLKDLSAPIWAPW